MLKRDVAKFIINNGVYQSGEVVLKSGLTSDHFYDFGNVNCSRSLPQLAMWLVAHSTDLFSVIFTSAYKGIMIATAMLDECGVCFPTERVKMGYLRKEKKDHGEGGQVVGYTPKAEELVLLVDDVLTSGQSLLEMAEFVESTGAIVEGAVVVVNRMSDDELKAFQEKVGIRINYLISDSEFSAIYKELTGNANK